MVTTRNILITLLLLLTSGLLEAKDQCDYISFKKFYDESPFASNGVVREGGSYVNTAIFREQCKDSAPQRARRADTCKECLKLMKTSRIVFCDAYDICKRKCSAGKKYSLGWLDSVTFPNQCIGLELDPDFIEKVLEQNFALTFDTRFESDGNPDVSCVERCGTGIYSKEIGGCIPNCGIYGYYDRTNGGCRSCGVPTVGQLASVPSQADKKCISEPKPCDYNSFENYRVASFDFSRNGGPVITESEWGASCDPSEEVSCAINQIISGYSLDTGDPICVDCPPNTIPGEDKLTCVPSSGDGGGTGGETGRIVTREECESLNTLVGQYNMSTHYWGSVSGSEPLCQDRTDEANNDSAKAVCDSQNNEERVNCLVSLIAGSEAKEIFSGYWNIACGEGDRFGTALYIEGEKYLGWSPGNPNLENVPGGTLLKIGIFEECIPSSTPYSSDPGAPVLEYPRI